MDDIYRRALLLAIAGLLSFTACDSTGSSDDDEPAMYTLEVHAEPAEGGEVSPVNEVYEPDSEVSVTATASEGWGFSGWTGDINASENPLTVTMSQDLRLTANFLEAADSENSFTYQGQNYPLRWGLIDDFGEFTDGFRNFDFVLFEHEEDQLESVDDLNSTYVLYFWLESLGADSFDPGSYIYSDETIQQNHINDGELIFVDPADFYMVVSGEVEVSISGDLYTLDIDVMLENGESLVGNFTYPFEILVVDEVTNPLLFDQIGDNEKPSRLLRMTW